MLAGERGLSGQAMGSGDERPWLIRVGESVDRLSKLRQGFRPNEILATGANSTVLERAAANAAFVDGQITDALGDANQYAAWETQSLRGVLAGVSIVYSRSLENGTHVEYLYQKPSDRLLDLVNRALLFPVLSGPEVRSYQSKGATPEVMEEILAQRGSSAFKSVTEHFANLDALRLITAFEQQMRRYLPRETERT